MVDKNIIVGMSNIYDYREYREMCVERGIFVEPWPRYVMMVETLLKGMEMFPQKDPNAAYADFIVANNHSFYNSMSEPATLERVRENCGHCGGGAAR